MRRNQKSLKGLHPCCLMRPPTTSYCYLPKERRQAQANLLIYTPIQTHTEGFQQAVGVDTMVKTQRPIPKNPNHRLGDPLQSQGMNIGATFSVARRPHPVQESILIGYYTQVQVFFPNSNVSMARAHRRARDMIKSCYRLQEIQENRG